MKEEQLENIKADLERVNQAVQEAASAERRGNRSELSRRREEESTAIKDKEAELMRMLSSIDVEEKKINTLQQKIAKKEQDIQRGRETIAANAELLAQLEESIAELGRTALEKNFTPEQVRFRNFFLFSL